MGLYENEMRDDDRERERDRERADTPIFFFHRPKIYSFIYIKRVVVENVCPSSATRHVCKQTASTSSVIFLRLCVNWPTL